MNTLLAVDGLESWFQTASGPGFLRAYLLWFLACWLLLLILRKSGMDHPLTSVAMLCLYEGMGIARYFVGSRVGMHRWDGLMMMMAFGALFFVIRIRSIGGGSNRGGGADCSAGGGCGGGGTSGGGGGGCGGCGGGD